MNSILFDFGIVSIKWYSVFILIAIISASLIIINEAKKKNIPEEFIYNLLFYGIIIGIVGARIYYVLFNLDYYLTNPSEIIMIWNGGLAIHGAIITALLFIIFYSKKNNISTLLILDIMVVGLLIAQSIGRWGNFFNQEAFGQVINIHTMQKMHIPKFIIDGMYIDGAYHEPTFLYESILSLIGFIVLLIIRKIKKLRIGQLFGTYLIWYGIERFIIEGRRTDSLMLGNIKVAQLVSLIGFIIGIYFIIKSIKIKKYYQNEKINVK